MFRLCDGRSVVFGFLGGFLVLIVVDGVLVWFDDRFVLCDVILYLSVLIVVVIGVNGLGKLIFVWLLNGLVVFISGCVCVYGCDIVYDWVVVCREVGFVFINFDV